MKEFTVSFTNENGEKETGWIICDSIEDAMKMFKQDEPEATDTTIVGYNICKEILTG